MKYLALDTKHVRQLQSGGVDANGQIAEHAISDGTGNPCRHCLGDIPNGESMLILGYRPFTTLQPYAEVGPVFLCANHCQRHDESGGVPKLYQSRKMLVRGYDQNERIIYGTGKIVAMENFESEAEELFDHAEVMFIHARSPSNNCYHFRIER